MRNVRVITEMLIEMSTFPGCLIVLYGGHEFPSLRIINCLATSDGTHSRNSTLGVSHKNPDIISEQRLGISYITSTDISAPQKPFS